VNRPPEPDATLVPFSFLQWRWLLVFLAVLPFQLLILQQMVAGPGATGFLNYDSPYYAANGRAIFERGNGLAYPNPYDSDPQSPAIYFHWLVWVLGFGIKVLHIDPGVLYAGIGVIAGVVCGAVTLRLVELVLPDPRGRDILYLLTMWGGGALCLAAAASNVLQGLPWTEEVLRLDPMRGWWFQNWGRNLLSPTEAVYHCLVAVAWIGVLRQRWGLAIGAATALAATHPFSGLQHLLILGSWLIWVAWRERTPAAIGRAAVLGGVLALFGFYYFWFLNRFPGHRDLQIRWSLAYPITLPQLLWAVGPLLPVVAWRLHRARWRLGETEKFWLLASAVTFLLLKHDWFTSPHQPAHFSRGYLWLPLWLLALPQLQTWGLALTAPPVRLTRIAALGAIVGLLCLDNATFLISELHSGEIDRVHLSPEDREMFAWMDRQGLRGVLLFSDTRLSYYASAYTGVRPYLGHLVNTPDMRIRWLSVSAWQRRGETGPWMEVIDYVLIRKADPPVGFDRTGWIELHGNDDYVLLGRAPAGRAGKPAPSAGN